MLTHTSLSTRAPTQNARFRAAALGLAVRPAVSEVTRSRLLFCSLCCYILSQAFTIPILPVGPSWAVWPTLSDFAVGLLILSFVLSAGRAFRPSRANLALSLLLLVMLAGSTVSWLVHLLTLDDGLGKAVSVGGFYLYRLSQFIAGFWIISRIPLTTERVETLRRITAAVLIFVCAGIVLTFFGIIPMSSLVAHLPSSLSVTGPWYFYRLTGPAGWGTIGTDHAYVAVQVIMLAGLYLHLNGGQRRLQELLVPLSTILVVFLTESRNGLAAVLLFVALLFIKKWAYLIPIAALLTGLLLAQVSVGLVGEQNPFQAAVERQRTVLDPADSENLNGRVEIWTGHLDFLLASPFRWLVGAGLGATMDGTDPVGTNAHMLYFRIVLETGLLGLLFFGVLVAKLMSSLLRFEPGSKPIFCATLTLLFSSLTQENLYPQPGFGHFLGLYLCAVAIALRVDFRDSDAERA